MPSIINLLPGSKAIEEPNKATLRKLTDRVTYLQVKRQKRRAVRDEITREIREIDLESDTLTSAITAKIEIEIAKFPKRPK